MSFLAPNAKLLAMHSAALNSAAIAILLVFAHFEAGFVFAAENLTPQEAHLPPNLAGNSAGSLAPPINEVNSAADVQTLLLWLDTKYREVRTFSQFEAAVEIVAKLISQANFPASKFSVSPEKDGDTREDLQARVDREQKSDERDLSLVPFQTFEAARRTIESEGSITNSIRREQSVVFQEALAPIVLYAGSDRLIEECRILLLERVGAALTDEQFEDFRELVLFDLFRIVLNERAAYGYLVVPPTDQIPNGYPELRILSQMSRSERPNKPAAFSSLALGVYRAAAHRSPEAARHTARQIFWLVRGAPMESCIVDLAFRDKTKDSFRLDPDYATGRSHKAGIFRLLLPRNEFPDENAWEREVHLQAGNCYQAIKFDYDIKWVSKNLQEQINSLHKHVAEIYSRIGSIEERLTALEKRMEALEARVTKLEKEVAALWAAVRELGQFTVEYAEFRNNAKFFPLPAELKETDLNPERENKLLANLAPIIVTDTKHPSAETIVSPAWFAVNCGILRPNPEFKKWRALPEPQRRTTKEPPRDVALTEAMFPLNDEREISNRLTAAITKVLQLPREEQEELKINCSQNSDQRKGPANDKTASMQAAIKNGKGVFGLVQNLGNVKNWYSVQYYVFFPYNSATISEIDLGVWSKRFHHGGDWLCVDLTVRLLDGDVDHPIIVLAYLHNHGPVIEVEPGSAHKSGDHLTIYLEYGCNEPQPLPGRPGDRHTNIPGIRRNERIEDVGFGGGFFGINEAIERIAVRSHSGNGYPYPTEHAVKNLRTPNDAECAFIREYRGAWGNDGAAPQSPFWNGKMRSRGFKQFRR